jgi:type I restriction enzyme, R subunit
VTLIEAKAENLPATHGLERAKLYAACKRLNVPFVIARNGHQFVMYDRIAGITFKPRSMAEIPSPAELHAAYESGMGFSLESQTAKPLLVKYQGGEATRRYYQDVALRAVFEHIAKGEKRAAFVGNRFGQDVYYRPFALPGCWNYYDLTSPATAHFAVITRVNVYE